MNRSTSRERRQVPRYLLDADILVASGHGWTIDISSCSVRFETETVFEPGAEVELVFPLHQLGPDATVRCKGQILRVDRTGPTFRVVAVYEPTAFHVGRERPVESPARRSTSLPG